MNNIFGPIQESCKHSNQAACLYDPTYRKYIQHIQEGCREELSREWKENIRQYGT